MLAVSSDPSVPSTDVKIAPRFIAIACVAVLLTPLARPRHAAAADDTARVQTMIDELASDDPAVRQRATEGLIALGGDARAAVLTATESDDPAIKSQATAVLLQLPWYRGSDSPEVQAVLRDYGSRDADGRQQIIGALLQITAYDALLRLLNEEPSDDVNWAIVSATRLNSDFAAHVRKNLDAISVDPPAAPRLALLGWAWRGKDAKKSDDFYTKVVELESQRPTHDGGEMILVFARLQADALGSGKPEAAAQLLRRQAKRGSSGTIAEMPLAVAVLFAVHADFGPLSGYDDDVRTYAAYAQHPLYLYAQGRLHQRKGEIDRANAAFKDAVARNGDSFDLRWETAEFLASRGWVELAEGELNAALQAAPKELPLERMRAHIGLSSLATQRHDDAAAAEHLDEALKTSQQLQERHLLPDYERLYRTNLEWRRLRIARTAGDAKAINEHLNELVRLSPDNPDIMLDIFPLLQEQGRGAETDDIFGRAYAGAQAKLVANPQNPSEMNNLAWVCARVGRRGDEALKHATAAIALEPDNPAYLDTAAEANFLAGNREEAIRLEKRALDFRPNDRFMLEQLHRFQTSPPKSPATQPAPFTQ